MKRITWLRSLLILVCCVVSQIVVSQTTERKNTIVIFDSWSTGSVASNVNEGIFTFTADDTKTMSVDQNSTKFNNGETYTTRLKTSGTSNDTSRLVVIDCPSIGTVKIAARTANNSATDRNIVGTFEGVEILNKVLLESDATRETYYTEDGEYTRNIYPIISVEVLSAGTLILSAPTGAINYYYLEFSGTSSGGVDPTPASDFSSSVLRFDSSPLKFTQSENYPWIGKGYYAMSSNQGVDYSSSWFSTEIAHDDVIDISFDWKVESEENYDFLRFYINDEMIAAKSGASMNEEGGSVQKFEEFSQTLTPGTYTLKWEYSKNGNQSADYDTGFIRNLYINLSEEVQTAITVELTTPGTLGEKALEQVEYLNQIEEIVIIGTLNDTDWTILKNSMTSLFHIDLSQVTNTTMPASQFNQKIGLQEIILPPNLTTINEYAFYGCSNLQYLDIPETVTTIGYGAFSYCDAITTITLPSELVSLGDEAFYHCDLLESIIIPEGVSQISSYTFYNCRKLNEVILHGNIKNIKGGAFYDCISLGSITLPLMLTEVGSYAFCNCPLESITFPASLASIGYGAFNSSRIKTITCLQPIPPALNNDPFYNVDKTTCQLIVPSWAETMYKLANIWSQFANFSTQDAEIAYLPVTAELALSENSRPLGTPDVTIFKEGKLTVRGNVPFAINQFRMENDLKNYWSSNSLFSTLINQSSSMTAEAVVINYSAVGGYWHYLSFPCDIAMSDVSIDEGKFYVFRKYDGASRALIGTGANWINMAGTDILRAGTGYIFQCNANVNNLLLKATEETKNQLFTNSIREVSLMDYPAESSENQSWNFVGNPFPAYFDINYIDYVAPITIWNGYSYEALSLIDDNYVLRPFEAFFIQKPTDVASINFLPEGRQTTSAVRSSARITASKAKAIQSDRKVLNLLFKNETLSDKSRIVINPEAKGDYEINCDAAKFMSTEKDAPQLYSLDANGVNYAINERPEGNGIIPLGIYVGTSGSYTFALQAMLNDADIILVDKKANHSINLGEEDYTFIAETGVDNDRFEIHFTRNATDVNGNEETTVKVNSGKGSLEIDASLDASVQIVTYAGVKVKEFKTSETITEVNLPQGTYLVIVNGQTYRAVVL